jgi:dipicolinate synthase subunit A
MVRQIWRSCWGRRHTVHTFALEKVPQADGVCVEQSLEGARLSHCVILPLPVSGEEGILNAPLSEKRHLLSEILDALRPGQVVCAGMVTSCAAGLAKERGLVVHIFCSGEAAIAIASPQLMGRCS